MWVNRHKLNNSLVVFLHGIFGNRWASWNAAPEEKGAPDILQNWALQSQSIRSYDMYLFQYTTRYLDEPALDPVVLDDLHTFLQKERGKYQTVVLVGHS